MYVCVYIYIYIYYTCIHKYTNHIHTWQWCVECAQSKNDEAIYIYIYIYICNIHRYINHIHTWQWCVECAQSKNDEALLDTVVDFLEFSTLRDVKLDEDPLVVFPCGHVFPISTADGFMGMDEVYERDQGTGLYVRAKPVVVSTV